MFPVYECEDPDVLERVQEFQADAFACMTLPTDGTTMAILRAVREELPGEVSWVGAGSSMWVKFTTFNAFMMFLNVPRPPIWGEPFTPIQAQTQQTPQGLVPASADADRVSEASSNPHVRRGFTQRKNNRRNRNNNLNKNKNKK